MSQMGSFLKSKTMYIEYIESGIKEADRMIDASEYDQAKDLLNRLLFDEPGYAKVHNNLGWLYQYCFDNKRQADLHLKYAIQFNPRLSVAFDNITELYIKDSRYDELQALLQNVISNGNVEPCVFVSLGRVYEAKLKFKSALKYYRKAFYATTDSYDADDIKDCIKRCRYKWIRNIF